MIKVHEVVRYRNGGHQLKEKWINPEDISGVYIHNGDLSLELPDELLPVRENFGELSKLIQEAKYSD